MSENPLGQSRVYDHDAMNTTFLLRLLEEDEATARSVAAECFYQLDQLENQLSRFIEGSDVSRINSMEAGETLYLSEPCHQCLLQAMEAAATTHGLFDITMGSRIEHQKGGVDGDMPDLVGKLSIHPDVPAITCEEPGRVIDLGGVGKGFALDELRKLLMEWKIEGAMLSAGASSLLAHGPMSWPVELKGDQGTKRIDLLGQSMSASGTGIQGSHIVHPWGQEAMPKEPCKRVWVVADLASTAEIWSTALMLIEPDQVEEATHECGESLRVYADRGGAIARMR